LVPVVFRLPREANARGPRRCPRGKYQFDARRDGAEFPVTCANQAAHGALDKVYRDTQLISARERDRRLSALSASRPLALVALDDPTVQKTVGLDGRTAMSKQCPTTILWAIGPIRARHRESEASPLLDDALVLARLPGSWRGLPRSPPRGPKPAWLDGESEKIARADEEAFELALQRGAGWPLGELGCWRWRGGLLDEPPAAAAEPYAWPDQGRVARGRRTVGRDRLPV
jgi:hypothetical protein